MGRQARNRISENEKRRSESKHGVGEAVAVAAGQTVQYAADNYMPSVEDCAEQERQRYAGGDIEPVDSVSFNPYREVPGQNAVQGVIIQDARHDGCCNTELCLSIWGVFCFGLVCAAAVPVASWIISKCHLPDAMRSVCSETRKPGKVETSDKSNEEGNSGDEVETSDKSAAALADGDSKDTIDLKQAGNEVETSSNSVAAPAEPGKVDTSDKSNEERNSGDEVETSDKSAAAPAEPGKVDTSDKSNEERNSGDEVETSDKSAAALAEPGKVETSDKSNEERNSGNEVETSDKSAAALAEPGKVETSDKSVSALYLLIKYYNLAVERLTRAKEIAAKTQEIADKIANSKLLAQYQGCAAQIPPKLHHLTVRSETEEVKRYETTDAWISELVGMNTNPEKVSVYSGLEPQNYLMAIKNGEDLEHYTDIADRFGKADYYDTMSQLDQSVVLQMYRLTLYDTVPFAVLNYTRNIANSQIKVFEALNEIFKLYPESVPESYSESVPESDPESDPKSDPEAYDIYLESQKSTYPTFVKVQYLKKLLKWLPGYLKSQKELTENSSDLCQEGFRLSCVDNTLKLLNKTESLQADFEAENYEAEVADLMQFLKTAVFPVGETLKSILKKRTVAEQDKKIVSFKEGTLFEAKQKVCKRTSKRTSLT